MNPGRGQIRSVLVAYEPSHDGDAALFYALELAREADATLTVTSVAPQERTDVGCGHCRASARVWNEQLRVLAHERLSQAAASLGETTDVQFLAACGPTRQVLAQAARQRGADIVVLPWRRTERLRRSVRLGLADDLDRRGPWEVVLAPRATPHPRQPPAPATSARQGTWRESGV